jgi:hypothetical protein
VDAVHRAKLPYRQRIAGYSLVSTERFRAGDQRSVSHDNTKRRFSAHPASGGDRHIFIFHSSSYIRTDVDECAARLQTAIQKRSGF